MTKLQAYLASHKNAVFAFELLTVAIGLSQYLREAMVTENSHEPHKHTPVGMTLTHTLAHTHTQTQKQQIWPENRSRTGRGRLRQRAIDHRVDGVR